MKEFPSDRQLDSIDCGPVCLKNLAKYYGKIYSIQYLKDNCGLTKYGVSLSNLADTAEQIGFRTLALKCSTDDLLSKIPLPAIIHWCNIHFIVVYKTEIRNISNANENISDESMIYVSDPAKGLLKYNAEYFSRRWIKKGTTKGVVLVVEPTNNFYERNYDLTINNAS